MDIEDAVNNNYVTSATQLTGHLMCTGHEHFDIHLIDEVFHVNVDEVFASLFTDSPFFQEFVQLRNTYDVSLGEWSDEPDENGVKTRLISYTLSINYSLGPKCSPSSETQHLLPESQPGACFLIDADCYNGGVPYADDFFTTVRYCIRKVGEHKTRLHISGRINYKRHIWGLIKTFIDKTASTGLATNFGVIANLFRRESERRKREKNRCSVNSRKLNEHKSFSSSHKSYSKPKGSVKERVSQRSQWRNNLNCVAPYGDNFCVTRRKNTVQPAQVDTTYSSTTDVLAMSVFVVVVFLVVVNLMLFYQITLLEATVSKFVSKCCNNLHEY